MRHPPTSSCPFVCSPFQACLRSTISWNWQVAGMECWSMRLINWRHLPKANAKSNMDRDVGWPGSVNHIQGSFWSAFKIALRAIFCVCSGFPVVYITLTGRRWHCNKSSESNWTDLKHMKSAVSSQSPTLATFQRLIAVRLYANKLFYDGPCRMPAAGLASYRHRLHFLYPVPCTNKMGTRRYPGFVAGRTHA